MKRNSILTMIIALLVCVSQIAHAQGGKEAKQAKGNIEANKLAREGAEALKSNDFDKAVDLLRKATNLDRKYTPDLAIAYERRGYALTKNQQFQDAVTDYTEAIKIKSNEPRLYEERAYAEMKIYAYDKALADYDELASGKMQPGGIRQVELARADGRWEAAYEPQSKITIPEDFQRELDNNQEAKERKQRLERKEAEKMPTPPPNTPAPKKSPPAKKKP